MAQKETPEEKQNRQMIEDIATNIAMLSRNVKSLLGGRLERKTILILLAHSTKMNQSEVEKVLAALEGMEKTYLKK